MCGTLDRIIEAFGEFSFSIKENANHRIVTTNGEGDFNDIVERMDGALRDFNGEVIRIEGKGEIIDLGILEAEIRDGLYIECYCYGCFSAYFIRILNEKALFIDKQWISIDIDESKKSLWFSD